VNQSLQTKLFTKIYRHLVNGVGSKCHICIGASEETLQVQYHLFVKKESQCIVKECDGRDAATS
jgi:hypothetical protein